jgi:hypothetical protein
MTALRNNATRAALLAVSVIFLALPAYAGKTDMQTLNVAPSKKTEAAAPTKADYRTLEDTGLYVSASEGSLGKDLWKDIKRSSLLSLLQDMPVESREPAVQRLIFGALLTQADSTMINNDIAIEPGRDLLTVRLEKLTQAGAYKQAQDLYSSLDDEIEPYHERLAQAGILAMMLNAEKSLACVEAETVRDTFAESKFIKEILAFCDVTMSENPSQESVDTFAALNLRNADVITSKDGAITYDPKSFDALPLIEKAFLTAQNKIRFGTSGVKDFAAIPPTHLRILLTADDLSADDRFMLTAAAEEWGLAMPGELLSLYKAAVAPASGQDPGTMNVPDSTKDWEKLGYYFVIASNAPDKEAEWNAIKKGFTAGRPLGIGTLKPYAEVLVKAEPGDARQDELETAIRILNATATPIPPQWRDRILGIQPSDEKGLSNQRLFALQTAVELAQNSGKKQTQNTEKASEIPYPANSRGGYLVKSIIENVDTTTANSDNAIRIYEKDYGLTFKQDYVMPSTVVWNHLLESSLSKNTGETVLLSASVLQAAELGNIYPGLLNDVRTGLRNVGLTDISSDLAAAAILGSIQTTKEN